MCELSRFEMESDDWRRETADLLGGKRVVRRVGSHAVVVRSRTAARLATPNGIPVRLNPDKPASVIRRWQVPDPEKDREDRNRALRLASSIDYARFLEREAQETKRKQGIWLADEWLSPDQIAAALGATAREVELLLERRLLVPVERRERDGASVIGTTRGSLWNWQRIQQGP